MDYKKDRLLITREEIQMRDHMEGDIDSVIRNLNDFKSYKQHEKLEIVNGGPVGCFAPYLHVQTFETKKEFNKRIKINETKKEVRRLEKELDILKGI